MSTFFQVTILMRVHHRNLTSLVGCMNDGGHLGLIYEYMARGNLAEHLSGNLLALATTYMLQHMLHNPIHKLKI